MKLERRFFTFFLAIAFVANAFAIDPEPEAEAVRPTGISKSSSSPAKAKTAKAKRARSTKKSNDDEDFTPTPPAPGGAVPATGARSVLIIDARSGQTLYEKNADETRAPASTQKLLTALIIAEHGFLDQTVRVETIDTLTEPVKLNIRAGDTYQRIDLLRALLVKSPNDVARCPARDHAGSVEAFAEVM